jgi:hypothetical protein
MYRLILMQFDINKNFNLKKVFILKIYHKNIQNIIRLYVFQIYMNNRI